MGAGWIAFIFFLLGILADEAYKYGKLWFKFSNERRARKERLKNK